VRRSRSNKNPSNVIPLKTGGLSCFDIFNKCAEKEEIILLYCLWLDVSNTANINDKKKHIFFMY
jgi:hypothetical protein